LNVIEQATVVIYDANVLYPASLRDLLMQLALSDLFQARWTNLIHDEWTRNVLKNQPDMNPAKLEHVRTLMNNAVADSLVTGFETLIPTLNLPDPNDRHVLAAAITAKANRIVTFNLKDFPTRILEPYRIQAQHPDEFICELLDDHLEVVLTAMRTVRSRLRNPPRSSKEYLERLAQQDLKSTVARLREHEAEI
jgi:predicted nucleic acid-binding protein